MLEPVQIKMARAALNWSAKKLGEKAGVGLATIMRFEGGTGVTTTTLGKLEKSLEKGGVIFIPRDASGGPGVRLKR
jgi:transcriptional regulator with XRE-family HTH domain